MPQQNKNTRPAAAVSDPRNQMKATTHAAHAGCAKKVSDLPQNMAGTPRRTLHRLSTSRHGGSAQPLAKPPSKGITSQGVHVAQHSCNLRRDLRCCARVNHADVKERRHQTDAARPRTSRSTPPRHARRPPTPTATRTTTHRTTIARTNPGCGPLEAQQVPPPAKPSTPSAPTVQTPARPNTPPPPNGVSRPELPALRLPRTLARRSSPEHTPRGRLALSERIGGDRRQAMRDLVEWPQKVIATHIGGIEVAHEPSRLSRDPCPTASPA